MKKLFAAFAMLALFVPALAFGQNLVTDAKLGRNVVDREITDETTTFAVGEKAYLWLRVEGGTGETLTVVWKINDLEFPVDLSIGAAPGAPGRPRHCTSPATGPSRSPTPPATRSTKPL